MVFHIVKFTQQTIDITWSIAAAVECTNAKKEHLVKDKQPLVLTQRVTSQKYL